MTIYPKDNTKLSWILEKRMLKEIMVLFISSSEKYKEHNNKIKANIIVLKFYTKT